MDIEATIGRRLDALAGGVRGLQDQLAATAEERARLRGIKFIRLAVVRGTASGSALTMGGDTGQAFATPDVVNILRAGRIIWQLNGNQFAQTWGRGEILLNAGETLTYQSVGTFNSTAQIIAHGTALETPGEFAGKLGA